MARAPADYTGQRFGALVAVRPASERLHWLCRCDCGAEVVLAAYRLRGGLTHCGACPQPPPFTPRPPDEKPCPICNSIFPRIYGQSAERWRKQATCSLACSVKYRRARDGGDHDTTQSRERARGAMTKKWEVLRAIAKAKAAAIPIRPSRQDEEAAIARWVAERGVTRADPVQQEVIQARHEATRPQPMAGWR